jgi:hypothetical protein
MICTVLIKILDISCISVSPIQAHESHICHPQLHVYPFEMSQSEPCIRSYQLAPHQWLRPYSLSRKQKMHLLVQIRKWEAPTRPRMRDQLLRTSSLYYETSHWSSQQEPRWAKRFRGFADLRRESITVCWRNSRRCTILRCGVCVVSTLE